jgi:hypothetical protein
MSLSSASVIGNALRMRGSSHEGISAKTPLWTPAPSDKTGSHGC